MYNYVYVHVYRGDICITNLLCNINSLSTNLFVFTLKNLTIQDMYYLFVKY